ncbi:hypothetical protein VTN77DRAFT_1609 [Rasamsonia byssochlamydoides]|uniref:uncharacterized protein n=1 Tax=Rasamsonia byssochlamydoides TaxID=89139 RepID=UPI00374203AC
MIRVDHQIIWDICSISMTKFTIRSSALLSLSKNKLVLALSCKRSQTVFHYTVFMSVDAHPNGYALYHNTNTSSKVDPVGPYKYGLNKSVVLPLTGPTERSRQPEVSIDTWEGLLNCPETSAVFKAHKNWPARLAAVSILFQEGFSSTVIVANSNPPFCWSCEPFDEDYILID